MTSADPLCLSTIDPNGSAWPFVPIAFAPFANANLGLNFRAQHFLLKARQFALAIINVFLCISVGFFCILGCAGFTVRGLCVRSLSLLPRCTLSFGNRFGV